MAAALSKPPGQLHPLSRELLESLAGQSLADRVDSMQRICSTFDFEVFPEETDWATFAGWRESFDHFPLPDSPG